MIPRLASKLDGYGLECLYRNVLILLINLENLLGHQPDYAVNNGIENLLHDISVLQLDL